MAPLRTTALFTAAKSANLRWSAITFERECYTYEQIEIILCPRSIVMIGCRHIARVFLVIIMLAIAANVVISDALTEETVDHHGQSVNDGNSKLCISCHDGTIGSHVLFCTVDCDVNRGHIVFKRYPPAGKERDFVPASVAKASGIVFENGQVTCISCHNVRNPERFHLVMSNKNSRLCLGCHIR